MMKKIIVSVGIFFLCVFQVFAQGNLRVAAGPTLFFGDISESKNVGCMSSVSVGIDVLASKGAVQINLGYDQGSLKGKKNTENFKYSFENLYKNFAMSVSVQPLKFTNLSASKFQPYVYAGYGFMWFRSRAFEDYFGLSLQSASYGYSNMKSVEPTCEVIIPHGIGFEYACTPSWSILMDCNRMFVASDKLDAIVSGKKDVYGSVSVGIKCYFGKEHEKNTSAAIESDDDDEVYVKSTKKKDTKTVKTEESEPVVVQDCSSYKSQLAQKDAEIKMLRDSLNKMSNIPESLKIKYCRKYLNGLLYRKCDVEVIKSNLAILDSARINDENINKYKYLLRNYNNWYAEFLTVVEYAQKDGRRYSALTSESNALRADVVNKINNLAYNKRSVANWQIYYLEDQINLLKRRLDEKVKHPEVIIDFSDLLK
ncbi:MAG: hypothetical protein MJ198_06820 [Bacteroidales bacterium]|nr:hypothetical protein [Bacteroidales bacterium]